MAATVQRRTRKIEEKGGCLLVRATKPHTTAQLAIAHISHHSRLYAHQPLSIKHCCRTHYVPDIIVVILVATDVVVVVVHLVHTLSSFGAFYYSVLFSDSVGVEWIEFSIVTLVIIQLEGPIQISRLGFFGWQTILYREWRFTPKVLKTVLPSLEVLSLTKWFRSNFKILNGGRWVDLEKRLIFFREKYVWNAYMDSNTIRSTLLCGHSAMSMVDGWMAKQ